MADERTFVIVGASLAGAKAAETLRSEGFTGRVVLIGAETERPYERPPLSKGYLQGKEPREKAYVHDAAWYSENRVELLPGVRVGVVHPAEHLVGIEDMGPLPYDKLLLATGSEVRRLDVPGVDNLGVHCLRTYGHADLLRGELREGARVVIIGAGWIGMEVAAAARGYGCDVTVVARDRLPLRRVLGDEVAQIFADLHRANGVEFRYQTEVREFDGAGRRVTHVVLDDATVLAADLVLMAVGVRPAVELAERAGLAVEDGVVTDESLRTSDPDIYACGDVASFWHPMLGRRIRVEHWSNALNGGPTAARAMLGQPVRYDRVPYVFSDQYDLGMEYAGYVPAGPGGYDSVVFRGDPSVVDGRSPECVAFWLAGDRVLAGMNINVWDVNESIQALVRAGYAGVGVNVDQLVDPSVPLADLAATVSSG